MRGQAKKKKKTFFLLRFFRGMVSFFRNPFLHKITGWLLIVISFFLFIGFSSYLFNYHSENKIFTRFSDESGLDGSWFDFFSDPDRKVSNWLGKTGAMLSYIFIRNGYGVASYLFVLITFMLGFRIVFNVRLLPLGKLLGYALFVMLWLPVALAQFIHHEEFLFIPGAYGYLAVKWLAGDHTAADDNGIIGPVGTGIFTAFSLLCLLIIAFKMEFQWFRKKAHANPDAQSNDTNNTAFNDHYLSVEINTGEENLAAGQKSEKTPETPLNPAEDTDPSRADKPDIELTVTEPAPDEKVTQEQFNPPADLKEFDPTFDLSKYQFPHVDLLREYGSNAIKVNKEELESNKNRIVDTLKNYNIEIEKIRATIGPSVTLYEIIPAPGVRISKIKNLEDDIALSLSALGIRIIAPIPGKGTIGLEVPNRNKETVSMKSIISSEKFQLAEMELPIGLGKTIANESYVIDLTKMPHLLMAGATGQGKSVGLNAILVSLLYRKHPAQVKFILIDPKKVELTLYNKIERHFLAKLPDIEEAIVTDTREVVRTLNALCIEMDNRYELLKDAKVRNIKEYNEKFIAHRLNPGQGHRYLPYFIVIIDEFADLIMTAGKEIETPLTRIAQLARAIGIHLVIATQRPSVNIITGTIKANFPARIAFRVTAKVDSRTILDSGGAEQLVGRGDMLLATGSDVIRIQCAFVDTPEVEEITDFIGNQRAYPQAYSLPEYKEESSGAAADADPESRDDFFEEAARIIVQHQQGSASLLQRRLKLGYNRAGRIIDQLEAAGIIGPFEGSKARKVLIQDAYALERFLREKNENDNLSD